MEYVGRGGQTSIGGQVNGGISLEFVMYTKLDREPVKVEEGFGEVLPELSVSKNPGRVLHIQEPVHR